MKLNEEYFYCFDCGAKGDVIDLVANLSEKEVIAKVDVEKVRCLLKYALYYLNDFYNGIIGGNNLMLRIHDSKKVEVDYCILIDEKIS